MSNKKTNKKLILFIVGCFIIISLFLINYTFVLAGEQQTSLQIPIPGFQEGKTKVIIGTNTLAEYINAIYQLSIKIISILAVLALMIGGLIWLASAGSEKQVTTAKNIIRNALIALLIVLFSYPLLYFINPSLTRLKDIDITKIKTAKFINLADECFFEYPMTGKDKAAIEEECERTCKLLDPYYKKAKPESKDPWQPVRIVDYYIGEGDQSVGGCCACLGYHEGMENPQFEVVWIDKNQTDTRNKIENNLNAYNITRKKILDICGGTFCQNEEVKFLYEQTETYKEEIIDNRCTDFCKYKGYTEGAFYPSYKGFIFECKCIPND